MPRSDSRRRSPRWLDRRARQKRPPPAPRRRYRPSTGPPARRRVPRARSLRHSRTPPDPTSQTTSSGRRAELARSPARLATTRNGRGPRTSATLSGFSTDNTARAHSLRPFVPSDIADTPRFDRAGGIRTRLIGSSGKSSMMSLTGRAGTGSSSSTSPRPRSPSHPSRFATDPRWVTPRAVPGQNPGMLNPRAAT